MGIRKTLNPELVNSHAKPIWNGDTLCEIVRN